MSFPDVARVVPISAISASEIGQKFRLFGVLVLSEDLTSHIAQLHSLTATKTGKAADGTSRKHQGRDAGPGVLVDLSLCMDRGNTVLKETASVVMVIGTLEENTISDLTGTSSQLVDESIILRAILMTDVSDVNLITMENAIAERWNFELSSRP